MPCSSMIKWQPSCSFSSKARSSWRIFRLKFSGLSISSSRACSCCSRDSLEGLVRGGIEDALTFFSGGSEVSVDAFVGNGSTGTSEREGGRG